MQKIIFISIMFLLFSCGNNINNLTERNEIEPNDNVEYSQFIDSDILIKANLDSEDMDYYNISPTNGFFMDFSINFSIKRDKKRDIKTDRKTNNINLEIFEENGEKTLFKLNTKDILNYNGNIEMKDLFLDKNRLFLKLSPEFTEGELKYNISFKFHKFNKEYIYKNETEPNDNFDNGNIIDYPNQIVYGYFIKNYNTNINYSNYANYAPNYAMGENIKPYLKNDNIIDIDFYIIENKTDIDSSINIIAEYKKDIDIILFDKDYKYIKESKNRLNADFKSESKYYIALLYYGEKYLIDRYVLYYNFN